MTAMVALWVGYSQKWRNSMASENKKRKAKNSYLISGADKLDGKMKRIMYYTKRQRSQMKQEVEE